MKMKRIFIITSFFLVILFGLIVKANQSLNEENESIFVDKRKIFFLYSDDNKIDDKLLTHTDELDLLAHNLFVFDNVKGDVKFGKPISIRNAPGLYYAPVFNDDSCIQFIKIGEDKYGNFSISMGFEFVQLINNLEDGTYYFESDIDTGYIYLRGNNIKICIDSDLPCNFENEFSEKDYVYKNYNEVSLNLYENISYAVKYQENITDNINNEKSLFEDYLILTPRFQNGSPGYCWLCCACELSNYYGGSYVSLETAHTIAHGSPHLTNGHSLYNCTDGGNWDDMNNVIDYYTDKTGTKTGSPLLASDTMYNITFGMPVISDWFYAYGTSAQAGHSMVIVGFSYNSSNNVFTYILHDPNYASIDKTIISTLNATSVVYYIGSNDFYWTRSLHDWS